MNRYKSILLIALIPALFFLTAGPAAAQAKVLRVSGKVEIKAPKGKWVQARQGMNVAAGSLIATGFKSSAQLELNKATLFVRQLTRLTLEEIAQKQNVVTTNLFIRTGGLEAEVKKGTDYTHDFKVRSPVSTAAVKGTRIRYDGMELSVKDGTAVLFNLLGQPMTVFDGDSAMSATGFDLLNSKNWKGLYFKLRLYLRNLGFKFGSLSGLKYLGDDTIVIFYPIWD